MEDYGVGDQFKATEPVSFAMLYRNHPNYPLKEDWLLFAGARQRTRTSRFDVVAAPLTRLRAAQVARDRRRRRAAIIPKTYPGQENAFVAGGAILPVSDYVDLCRTSRTRSRSGASKPEIDTLRQEDGKYYLLPGFHEEPRAGVLLCRPQRHLGRARPEPRDPRPGTSCSEQLRDSRRPTRRLPDVRPLVGNGPLEGTLFVSPNFGTRRAGASAGHHLGRGRREFVYTGATDQYAIWSSTTRRSWRTAARPGEGHAGRRPGEPEVRPRQVVVIGTNEQEIVRVPHDVRPSRQPTPRCAKIRVPAGPAGDNPRAASRQRLHDLARSRRDGELPGDDAVRRLAVLLRRRPGVRQVGRRGHHVTPRTPTASGF